MRHLQEKSYRNRNSNGTQATATFGASRAHPGRSEKRDIARSVCHSNIPKNTKTPTTTAPQTSATSARPEVTRCEPQQRLASDPQARKRGPELEVLTASVPQPLWGQKVRLAGERRREAKQAEGTTTKDRIARVIKSDAFYRCFLKTCNGTAAPGGGPRRHSPTIII